MMYDFDTIINRYHTNSSKYDFAAEHHKPDDVIPMWIADMDFRCPPAVTEALQKVCETGIYGYADPTPALRDAIVSWYQTRFHYTVDPEWILHTPGVVFAIATAIRTFTEVQDAVLIQEPVYHPFKRCIVTNERRLINSPLVCKDGAYTIDFDDFEQKIADNHVKMFILCSPHNPVGRVWTVEELTQMVRICRKYNVLIVSDEIHADFTYPGHPHTVLASIAGDYASQIITLTAPSKTFNLAGLQISNIFIADEARRRAFSKALTQCGYGGPGIMGIAACQAAYEKGADWLDALLRYLQDNIAFVRNFLKDNLPAVHLIESEGTYLLWLDFSELGLSDEALEDLMVNGARLWLDAGTMFGESGRQFERFNIACPRSVLRRAFEQLKAAVDSL